MSATVQIPLPLTSLAGASGGVEANCPGVGERLFSGHEELSRFVSIFVDGQGIRLLEGPGTAVKEGGMATILPGM
jgi:hypothetical protein